MRRNLLNIACLSLTVILLVTALPAGAQVFFSHDIPGFGLPGSAVAAAPDAGDIFLSFSTMCGPAWGPGTNVTQFLKGADFGLLPGDTIDAYSVRHQVESTDWAYWRFSVHAGSSGTAGSAVSTEVPHNGADIFWTDGTGGNLRCLWEWQLGLFRDDELDALEKDLPTTAVFFSLTPGSPSLGALGATPGDILGVVPGSGLAPTIAFTHSSMGLAPTDDVDGLTLATVQGVAPDVVFFSVVSGATAAPPSAVASLTPNNGSAIFFSPIDFSNYLVLDAPSIGLLDIDELDALTPAVDETPPPPTPKTAGCDYTIMPTTGTLPFNTLHDVTVENLYPSYFRFLAARISVTLAGGAVFPNWKSGLVTLPPSGSFSTSFNQVLPASPAVLGTNVFELSVEDVTPAPFNMPPYPPAGDTCFKDQFVVGGM